MDIHETGLRNYFEEDRGFKNGAGEVYYYNANGKGLNLDPVSAGVDAAATIANTIAGISDMKQRREFDRATGRLSLDDQRKLGQQLQKAKSREAKLAIITAEVNKFRIEESKKQTRNMTLIIGGSLVFLLVVVYLVKK